MVDGLIDRRGREIPDRGWRTIRGSRKRFARAAVDLSVWTSRHRNYRYPRWLFGLAINFSKSGHEDASTMLHSGG